MKYHNFINIIILLITYFYGRHLFYYSLYYFLGHKPYLLNDLFGIRGIISLLLSYRTHIGSFFKYLGTNPKLKA